MPVYEEVHHVHKKLTAAAFGVVLTVACTGAASGIAVGGGQWSYGTSLAGVAYSNYYHPSNWHGSSVMVEADVVRSPCTAPKSTAKASKWRTPWDEVHVYYRTSC